MIRTIFSRGLQNSLELVATTIKAGDTTWYEVFRTLAFKTIDDQIKIVRMWHEHPREQPVTLLELNEEQASEWRRLRLAIGPMYHNASSLATYFYLTNNNLMDSFLTNLKGAENATATTQPA